MSLLEETALSVARCPLVELARDTPSHPCHQIVSLQPAAPAEWQVPEGWAGDLAEARIVFVSSNPSISTADDRNDPTQAEDYPRGSWTDEEILSFVTHRFDPRFGFATVDGRHRCQDGSYSKPTRYWVKIREQASWLFDREADPNHDYAMTEVVHCKSKAEVGVAKAAATCVQTHMDPIVSQSRAGLIVIVGSKARDRITASWELPEGFGTKVAIGNETANLAVRTIGGRCRVVAYLWHVSVPTGGPATFAKAYPTSWPLLREVAAGRLNPERFEEAIRDAAVH